MKWCSLALVLLSVACRPKVAPWLPDGQLVSDLDAIRSMRIFFGHQSVGTQLLEQVQTFARETGAAPPRMVAATDTPGNTGFFAESTIGHNANPVSKCDDFVARLDRTSGPVDIALMKFCYVDFNQNTNVRELLQRYERSISIVRLRRPGITIVHVTAPLVAQPRSWKTRVKNWIGRAGVEAEVNLVRCRYNELLRARFADDPVFDLASAESTYADGRRESFRLNGETGYHLIPEYTSDGGHLNSFGCARVARELVRTLANVARQRQQH